MKNTQAETAAKKGPMPTYRVFVSSTYSDMIPYRDAVKEAIERCDCQAIGMERFGAASIPPLEKCFNQLAPKSGLLYKEGAELFPNRGRARFFVCIIQKAFCDIQMCSRRLLTFGQSCGTI